MKGCIDEYMVVLIIDDLPEVVNGIILGVNWSKIGVTKTLCANSSLQAKKLFENNNIDIILSDIEMPVESGIDLLRWVRAHYKDTECVFLTSHADFGYAQTAIKLGAADYLLQPATYDSIETVLEKVINQIKSSRAIEEYKNNKHSMLIMEDQYRISLLREFVLDINCELKENIDNLFLYNKFIESDVLVQSILVHVVGWHDNIEKLETNLLSYMMENVLKDLFQLAVKQLLVIPVNTDYYMVVIFNDHNHTQDQIIDILEYFVTFSASSVHYDCACYVDGKDIFRNLPDSYSRLYNLSLDNVVNLKGVYVVDTENNTQYVAPNIQYWRELIGQNHFEQAEMEVHKYFESLVENKRLNMDVLFKFQQDFIQMFFEILQNYNMQAHEIIDEGYNYDLIVKSCTSLETMLDLVNFVISYIKIKQEYGTTSISQMDRVMEFIQNNIRKNVGRKEIAEAVYLNPEYLSRLFKKENGISLSNYLVQEKMQIAENLLKTTSFPVGIIASKIGYSNFSHFAKAFKKVYGISPSEYRQSEKANLA